MAKEPLRLLGDPLRSNARRKYGAQGGRLVPCSVKPNLHGFHPENEYCPDCLSWSEQMDLQPELLLLVAQRAHGRAMFTKYTGRPEMDFETLTESVQDLWEATLF